MVDFFHCHVRFTVSVSKVCVDFCRQTILFQLELGAQEAFGLVFHSGSSRFGAQILAFQNLVQVKHRDPQIKMKDSLQHGSTSTTGSSEKVIWFMNHGIKFLHQCLFPVTFDCELVSIHKLGNPALHARVPGKAASASLHLRLYMSRQTKADKRDSQT